MSNTRPCAIETCERNTPPQRRLIYCEKHQYRWRHHGDPMYEVDRTLGRGSVEERLAAKSVKTDACWLWIGKVMHKGYGRMMVNGKHVGVHRLSYELHVGPIPDGMFILHSCDVRNCIRPDHLRVGDAADNMQDCVDRDRVSRKASRPKLTAEQVTEIRARYASGERPTALAAEYGVQRNALWKAAVGRTWREVA